MVEREDNNENPQPKTHEKPLCSCVPDPFAGIPAEIRPRPKTTMAGLRQVACPVCDLVYWTNRKTDLCIDCEKVNPK